ncbi:MAG TPA: fumarylacetoacetate hydrolase family protein [Gemmataceae bacterium]|jgi:2-keto-4-pentenoate hydratase/2-oxohepta-3-ene-1,7-dioic acid hydratase in catechol pathway|nr:fumarylacetoacetate hydrolase family protein [Gemmataceae bacterium]
MRLCRIGPENTPRAAFYLETQVVPVATAVVAHSQARGTSIHLPTRDDLVPLLLDPSVREIATWLGRTPNPPGAIPMAQVELLVPIPKPPKLFCLAGNYAEHVAETGGTPAERAATFPYVFMKPPSTTLLHPNRGVAIPKVAPDGVDHEVELAVIIGRKGKHIAAADASKHIAGYTIVNDVTQRRYRPNPGRTKREKDVFFDWLHGKWFDSFCPSGPCAIAAAAVPDAQNLTLELTVNGDVKQKGSTAQMVFPVGAIIEFISKMVTLEPGDIISTGTPAGVGAASNTFLKPGDVIKATIQGIGTLVTPVVAEK